MITVYEVATELVNYFINNWNDYITNIFHRDVIKLTYKDIAEVFCAMYPMECRKHRRGQLPAKTAWLFAYIMAEFEKRGYKVEKVKICCNRTALYIHKV
jgi:hypothetical protein